MNSVLQSELTLFADAHAAPIADLLRRSSHWLNAEEILLQLGIPATETARRQVRRCAESLGDQLISGQQGYRHVDAASADEVKHFCNWMDSQGDKMKARALRTRTRKGL